MSQTWLIVPAAGQGRRMGADKPKQYLTLADDDEQPVLAHTLARLYCAFPNARLVLCLDPDDGCFCHTGYLSLLGSACRGAASEWTAC